MLLAYTCTRGTQEVFRIRRIRPRVADCSDVRVVVEFPVRDRARRRREGETRASLRQPDVYVEEPRNTPSRAGTPRICI